jgi:hypothetical protein
MQSIVIIAWARLRHTTIVEITVASQMIGNVIKHPLEKIMNTVNALLGSGCEN